MPRQDGISELCMLVFWGWVLGPIGMLLSVPLTITAKLGLEANPNTRWVAILLGGSNASEPKKDNNKMDDGSAGNV